ncbi:hypothetical protein, partial [Proteus mirabilis]|uniref:hypothetical protein n=1 Tax=Proteus mirabilis TaxID=584 RepID=UPI001953B1A7
TIGNRSLIKIENNFSSSLMSAIHLLSAVEKTEFIEKKQNKYNEIMIVIIFWGFILSVIFFLINLKKIIDIIIDGN